MKLIFNVWILLVLTLFASAPGYSAGEAGAVGSSQESIHFRISYQSNVNPIPLNRIHSWLVHVETHDGEPVDNAEITVYGGMPTHRHDLPTQPVATRLGGGDYLVEGMKFSMLGHWIVRIEVEAGKYNDTVAFEIDM
jgi:hypothetical protein